MKHYFNIFIALIFSFTFSACFDDTKEVEIGSGITIAFTQSASGVSIASEFVVSLPKAADLANLDNTILLRVDGSTVNLKLIFTQSGSTLTITPNSSLSYSTNYELTFTSAFTFADGAQLGETTSYGFTTESTTDDIAPTIISISPFDGETDVLNSRTITVVHSETLDVSSVKNAAITLEDSDSTLYELDIAVGDDTVILTPKTKLKYNKIYTLTLQGYSDLAQNSLDVNVTTFTTPILADINGTQNLYSSVSNPNRLIQTYHDISYHAVDDNTIAIYQMNKLSASSSLFRATSSLSDVIDMKRYKQNLYDINATSLEYHTLIDALYPTTYSQLSTIVSRTTFSKLDINYDRLIAISDANIDIYNLTQEDNDTVTFTFLATVGLTNVDSCQQTETALYCSVIDANDLPANQLVKIDISDSANITQTPLTVPNISEFDLSSDNNYLIAITNPTSAIGDLNVYDISGTAISILSTQPYGTDPMTLLPQLKIVNNLLSISSDAYNGEETFVYAYTLDTLPAIDIDTDAIRYGFSENIGNFHINASNGHNELYIIGDVNKSAFTQTNMESHLHKQVANRLNMNEKIYSTKILYGHYFVGKEYGVDIYNGEYNSDAALYQYSTSSPVIDVGTYINGDPYYLYFIAEKNSVGVYTNGFNYEPSTLTLSSTLDINDSDINSINTENSGVVYVSTSTGLRQYTYSTAPYNLELNTTLFSGQNVLKVSGNKVLIDKNLTISEITLRAPDSVTLNEYNATSEIFDIATDSSNNLLATLGSAGVAMWTSQGAPSSTLSLPMFADKISLISSSNWYATLYVTGVTGMARLEYDYLSTLTPVLLKQYTPFEFDTLIDGVSAYQDVGNDKIDLMLNTQDNYINIYGSGIRTTDIHYNSSIGGMMQ